MPGISSLPSGPRKRSSRSNILPFVLELCIKSFRSTSTRPRSSSALVRSESHSCMRSISSALSSSVLTSMYAYSSHTGICSSTMIRVDATGLPNLPQPDVTYASEDPLLIGPKFPSPSLKPAALLMWTTTAPWAPVYFLKSSPTSKSLRYRVKLFGATYSASAASIDDWTKDDIRGKSMMFKLCLLSGTQDRSAFGCPKKVMVAREKKGGSGVSCNLTRIVPIIPRISTQTGIAMLPGR